MKQVALWQFKSPLRRSCISSNYSQAGYDESANDYAKRFAKTDDNYGYRPYYKGRQTNRGGSRLEYGEGSAVGPAVVRAVTPVEKTIPLAISDWFQREVGEKAVNQLEKSVNSKLEDTVSRQIEAQFQTLGKQALQLIQNLKILYPGKSRRSFKHRVNKLFRMLSSLAQKLQ